MVLKVQIALEFMIIFSFIMVIFLFMFALIATQRSSVANQQSYSELQNIAQNIAQQIDLAESSGSGYYSNISLYSQVGVPIFNLSIENGGIVILTSKIETQFLRALAYSNVKNIEAPTYLSNNTLTVENYNGQICVDTPCFKPNNYPNILQTSTQKTSMNGKSGYLINTYTSNQSGSPSQNAIIGFASTNNNFSNYAFSVNKTNNFGVANVFLNNYNSYSGSLVRITPFQGGTGMFHNLSQFLPLNLGSGNYIYDLSGYNSIGYLTNVSWAMPNYAAEFLGNSYIKLNTPPIQNSFTISFWVMPSSIASEQILGQNGTDSGTLSLSTTSSPSMPNFYELNIQGFGNVMLGSYIPNTWSMLSITYNSITDNLSTYQNGYLLNSYTDSISPNTIAPFYIGAANPIFSNSLFSGKLANLQFYSVPLKQNAILNLSVFGVSTPPVQSGNILLWMPLNGDMNNYANSYTNSYGINVFGSIPFIQQYQQINNSINQTNLLVANFNGANSLISIQNPYNSILDTGSRGGEFAVSLWFNLSSQQAQQPLLSTYPYTTCGFSANILTTNTILFSDNCGNTISYQIPLFQNRWYNLIISRTYSNALNYYVNGVLVYNTQFPSIADSGSWSSINIGTSSSAFFDGSMSNIQFYNTSISNNQAKAFFDKGLSYIPRYENLTLWMPLDGSPNNFMYNSNSVPSNIIYQEISNKPTTPYYPLLNSGLIFNGNGGVSGNANTVIGTNTFTINAWVYPAPFNRFFEFVNQYVINGGAISLAINKGTGTPSNSFLLNLSVSYAGSFYYNIGGAITPYTWSQITGVYNGKNLTTYINGKVASVEKFSANLPTQVSSFSIGGYNIANFPWDYSGIISDVSLYKSPLNSTQINYLYYSGAPKNSKVVLP
ncbi:MAG: LamG-like jellyroll fold domain-containing protein [Candidatus Micrarchaeia archaeon]